MTQQLVPIAAAAVQIRTDEAAALEKQRSLWATLGALDSLLIALSGGAVVFHPDAEAGVDDLAARPHGAPHLPHRQAFERCEAVMVRRIHRPL